MPETKKRNVHLPEFKAQVGLEAVRGVKTINEIAQDFGVHPVQVSQRKRNRGNHTEVIQTTCCQNAELILSASGEEKFVRYTALVFRKTMDYMTSAQLL